MSYIIQRVKRYRAERRWQKVARYWPENRFQIRLPKG